MCKEINAQSILNSTQPDHLCYPSKQCSAFQGSSGCFFREPPWPCFSLEEASKLIALGSSHSWSWEVHTQSLVCTPLTASCPASFLGQFEAGMIYEMFPHD